MKKDPLNLINTGIDYIKFIKNFFFYIIAVFFLGCSDDSLSPTWYTTINLPLTSTDIFFSDIVADCIYENEILCNSDLSNQCLWETDQCINNLFSFTTQDSIITLLFEDTVIDQGELGLTTDDIFSTEIISIEELYSFQNDFDVESLNGIEDIKKSIKIDIFELLPNNIPEGMDCIPINSVNGILDSILTSNNINDTIELPLETIETYFNPYEYLTINEFSISKTFENTSPINVALEIQIYGTEEIYSEIVSENIDEEISNTLSHQINDSVELVISTQLLDSENYCQSEIPTEDYTDENSCESAGSNFLWQFTGEYGCYDVINNVLVELDEENCQPDQFLWQEIPACYEIQDGYLFDGDDRIVFDFGFKDINVESIRGALVIPLESHTESIDLPAFGDGDLSFELRGAKISDDTSEDVNQLSISYSSNTNVNISFQIVFENFEDNTGHVLTENFTIEQGQDSKIIRLEECLFLHPDNVGLENDDEYNTLPIENLSYQINFIDQDIKTHILADLQESDVMSISIEGIQIQPLEFEYLNAAVEELIIKTPSVQFDDIPSGFDGLVFANPIMEIDISNQIGIGSQIEMYLHGINDSQEEFELDIIGEIFELSDPDNEVQNSCLRVIEDCVCSFKGTCDEFEEIDCDQCELNAFNNQENYKYNSTNISLSEFLQQGPATLGITKESKAILQGTGKLYANTYVWGDFSLIAPFSLTIGDQNLSNLSDLNIMPSDPTEIAAIEGSTKEMIDNALVEASIISTIENNSYIIGEAAIMVSSNEFFFPLNIDEIVEDLKNCIQEDNSVLNTCAQENFIDAVIAKLNDDYLNSIQGSINKINFSLIDSEKIKTVDFLDTIANSDSPILEYGRLINLILPGPSDFDEDMNFSTPFFVESYSSSMDALQLKMINQSSSQKFINTIISLQNSYDLNDDGEADAGSDGIINIYNNDYISIQSYISFLVNPSGF